MDYIIVDICFFVLFLSVPVIALRLLPFAGVSIFKFSIPSLFVIFYLAFAYVGILPLYFGWDDYPIYLGVVNKAIIFQMFVYSSSALMVIICGFISAHRLIGFNSDVTRHRTTEKANRTQIALNVFLLLLCGLVLLTYLKQVESIAMLKIISGDFAGAAVARSDMGNSFSGKYWRYQLFMRYLLDYAVLFFLTDYLLKRTKISMLFFLMSFLVAVFTAIMALEKGPLANLLIMCYLVYVIIKGGKYWQTTTKYLIFIFIGILISIYILSIGGITGDRTFVGQFLRMFSRILTGQLTPAYFYLDLFPNKISYLLGFSLPNPGGLLPFEHFPLTLEVANHMFPDDSVLGVSGSAPTAFWGEMYVNFGPLAVLLSSFYVGIGLFVISHILSKQALSPPTIAAIVTLAMHYKTLSATSLSNYFIDTTLFSILFITLIQRILKNGKQYKLSVIRDATNSLTVP